jgi:hypothetical protein
MDELLVLVLEVKGNVRLMQKVIIKILFDVISSVPETEHKIIVAVMGVDLHDMPKNGMFAHLDHGLGF